MIFDFESKYRKHIPSIKSGPSVPLSLFEAGTTKPSIEEARKQGSTDYIELDCSENKYRSVKSERESREGYTPFGPTHHWYNIEPDSVYEKMGEVVCERK